MKPHKHAEVLRAIADGKEAQWQSELDGSWNTPTPYNNPISDSHLNWRIKPEPKPDAVAFAKIHATFFGGASFKWCFDENDDVPNIKLTFYGETGQLKSAEVLK